MKTVARKRLYPAAMPWVLGLSVCVLGYSSDIVLAHAAHSEWVEMSDDVVLGLLVALVGTWWLRRRNRAVIHELQRIANINHLIRNELEVILYSVHAPNNAPDIKHVQNSVEQISWILRELLGPDPAIVQYNSAARARATGTDDRSVT